MKYALLVGDGMADFPIDELGGRTPLAAAQTPNMDRIAREGTLGRVATVPAGMPPGSDVANLALMGYDPRQYYRGRAPVEAASMGVALGENDVAFRCNLVTLDGDIMGDYSAGHIETDDAHALIAELQNALGSDTIRFHPGISYRHLLVASAIDDTGLQTTPPHDIIGRPWREHLPHGAAAAAVCKLMESARDVLAASPVNAQRVSQGKRAATDIWLWGQGRAVSLPSMRRRYGLSGSVISAVDLVRGLGVLAGLTVRIVEGATGYLGTNYAGKVAAAAQALDSEDLVYLHVEAPDETGHEGVLAKKIQAIEEFDRNVVGEMLRIADERGDLRVMVAPDHATPIALRTHHEMPVPVAVCGPGVTVDAATEYCEAAAAESEVIDGPAMFDRFIRGTDGAA
ncbi:MAG: cofactor-independent phosphoglycerate mutase [Chitinivibrionales bacterium]|nr:cofactor-independent phosphoglycerate mutase [Chitinivibrionales bacterium]